VNTPPELAANTCEASLIDIVVETWRLSRTFQRVLTKLDAGEAARYQGQLRFFLKRLEEVLAAAQLRIVDLEGQAYDPGMAATPLNIADFGPEDCLRVEQMIEPLIMGTECVKRIGTIMLRRANL